MDGNIYGYELNKKESIDIDDVYDFKFAEYLFVNDIKLNDQKTMKNNLVLITGGAGHIGEAIAKEFANQKSDLILIDIDKKHLEKTKLMIEKTYNVRSYI